LKLLFRKFRNFFLDGVLKREKFKPARAQVTVGVKNNNNNCKKKKKNNNCEKKEKKLALKETRR
jgi:hypothetical protein